MVALPTRCPECRDRPNLPALPATMVGRPFVITYCHGAGHHRRTAGRLVAIGPDPDLPGVVAYGFVLFGQVIENGRLVPTADGRSVIGTTFPLWPSDAIALEPVTEGEAADLERIARDADRTRPRRTPIQ